MIYYNLSSTRVSLSIIKQSSTSESSSEAQETILKSLATKNPVVGSSVVVPVAPPGAGVEDLVGEVLGGRSSGNSSYSGIERPVASEESCAGVVAVQDGSLRLGSSFNEPM